MGQTASVAVQTLSQTGRQARVASARTSAGVRAGCSNFSRQYRAMFSGSGSGTSGSLGYERWSVDEIGNPEKAILSTCTEKNPEQNLL